MKICLCLEMLYSKKLHFESINDHKRIFFSIQIWFLLMPTRKIDKGFWNGIWNTFFSWTTLNCLYVVTYHSISVHYYFIKGIPKYKKKSQRLDVRSAKVCMHLKTKWYIKIVFVLHRMRFKLCFDLIFFYFFFIVKTLQKTGRNLSVSKIIYIRFSANFFFLVLLFCHFGNV